ncbi:hypothetical protein RAA17_13300 [Komagataeibacter rhaeticus]|nr:hypothetical protein [Komagataeibacter rhaeticus]
MLHGNGRAALSVCTGQDGYAPGCGMDRRGIDPGLLPGSRDACPCIRPPCRAGRDTA